MASSTIGAFWNSSLHTGAERPTNAAGSAATDSRSSGRSRSTIETACSRAISCNIVGLPTDRGPWRATTGSTAIRRATTSVRRQRSSLLQRTEALATGSPRRSLAAIWATLWAANLAPDRFGAHAIVTAASKLRISESWDLESSVTARALRAVARRTGHLTTKAAEHEREILKIVRTHSSSRGAELTPKPNSSGREGGFWVHRMCVGLDHRRAVISFRDSAS